MERHQKFHTTRWSVVQAAGGGDSDAASRALEQLCESYWFPLYAFVRRSGHDAAEAEDLTQGFFARLLEKRDFTTADPARGKFRSYLLASLKHYVANEWDRARAQKRGGGSVVLSLDFEEADRQYRLEADESSSPEVIFERQWAMALLGSSFARLREEYAAQGKGALFDALRPELLGESADRPREELAASLSMNTGTLNVALHRLRKRFGERLRAEVRHTVADPADTESELKALLTLLGS